MSRKDRQRWKSVLLTKTSGEQVEKVKQISYQMEVALLKMDEQNQELRKQGINVEKQTQDRINEVHLYYGNLMKKRGGNQADMSKQFEEQVKKIDQLNKENQKLNSKFKQQTKRANEMVKLVKINEDNVNHYEEVINKMKDDHHRDIQVVKTDYENRIKQASKQIATMTNQLSKLRAQNQNELKRMKNSNDQEIKLIKQTHARQITRLRADKANVTKARQTQIHKEAQSQYNNLLVSEKQKFKIELDHVTKELKAQHNALLAKTQKQMQLKLTKQSKAHEETKAELARIKKTYEASMIDYTRRIESIKTEGVKQTSTVKEQLSKAIQAQRKTSQKEILTLKDQNNKLRTKELQLTKRIDAQSKQIEKIKNDRQRLQTAAQNLKQEHLKRSTGNQNLYQKNIQKLTSEHNFAIEGLQKEVKNISNTVTQKQKQNGVLTDANTRLQKEIKLLSDQKSKLEATIQKMKADHQKRINNTQTVHGKNVEKMETSLKIATEKHEKEIEKLKSSLENGETYISELNDVIMNKDKEIKNILSTISKRDAQIARLNDTVDKKDKEIKRFTDLKEKQVGEISNLYGKINEMIPQEEVNKMHQKHQSEIQKLQNELWQIHDQMGRMVPSSEVDKLKEKGEEEKKRLGQDYQSVTNVISELKSRLQQTERRHKETVAQLKHAHREQLTALSIEHENKLIQLKNHQSEENDRKQTKYSSTMSQLKEDLKAEHSRQLNRIRDEHRKYMEELNEEKKRQINELKNEINMVKNKNVTLQKQIELTQNSIIQHKQDSIGRLREDQMTIVSLRTKVEQAELREKHLTANLRELEHSLKETEQLYSSRQKQYDKDLRALEQKLQIELHEREVNALKKQNDVNSEFMRLKQNYDGRMVELEKKQTNEKKYLNEKIGLLESRLIEKDKDIEKLRKDFQTNLNEAMRTREQKDGDERLRQRKIQEGIEEIMSAKHREFSKFLKEIEEKNEAYNQQILTLQNSNRVLRQQLSASLTRGNREKEMYDEINKLKSQLSHYEKKTSNLLSVSSAGFNKPSVRSPTGYRQVNVNRSINLRSHSNLDSKEEIELQQPGRLKEPRPKNRVIRNRAENGFRPYDNQYMTPRIFKQTRQEITNSTPGYNPQQEADGTETQKKFKTDI